MITRSNFKKRSLAAVAGLSSICCLPADASLFQTGEVKAERFILVAAPIGDGSNSQLNIYEQVRDRRPCFARKGNKPTVVNPLLGTFDFTGICNRYVDSNGYSVRIGNLDFGPAMRLTVSHQAGEAILMGHSPDGLALLVARAGGGGSGFVELKMEPGWKVMRRQFRKRALGHVYIYRDTMPETK
ncbi:MAG: DUF3747 domain-containing protein [Cyanobacteria bacterium]|nr:DUF3747 domain-containing protein [Cyanobacteriota bacterium]